MLEPYCRLYIDTDEDRSRVRSTMDECLRAAFQGIMVDASVFKNTAFDAHARARRRYDPIECSPLTSEVCAIDERPEHVEPFQAGTVRLIRELRARGYTVTASCDFEERVSQETGWNWSMENTEPPGRAHR